VCRALRAAGDHPRDADLDVGARPRAPGARRLGRRPVWRRVRDQTVGRCLCRLRARLDLLPSAGRRRRPERSPPRPFGGRAALRGWGLAGFFSRGGGGAAAIKDHRRALWEGALLLAGALVPLAAVSAVLLASGTFANFWFWTFRYAAQYGAGEPMRDALWNLGHSSREFLPAVWPVVAAAVIALLLLARDRELRRNRAFAVLLIVFSSLAVLLTGFHLRHHYFLLMTPAMALLAGAAPFALARRVVGA